MPIDQLNHLRAIIIEEHKARNEREITRINALSELSRTLQKQFANHLEHLLGGNSFGLATTRTLQGEFTFICDLLRGRMDENITKVINTESGESHGINGWFLANNPMINSPRASSWGPMNSTVNNTFDERPLKRRRSSHHEDSWIVSERHSDGIHFDTAGHRAKRRRIDFESDHRSDRNNNRNVSLSEIRNTNSDQLTVTLNSQNNGKFTRSDCQDLRRRYGGKMKTLAKRHSTFNISIFRQMFRRHFHEEIETNGMKIKKFVGLFHREFTLRRAETRRGDSIWTAHSKLHHRNDHSRHQSVSMHHEANHAANHEVNRDNFETLTLDLNAVSAQSASMNISGVWSYSDPEWTLVLREEAGTGHVTGFNARNNEKVCAFEGHYKMNDAQSENRSYQIVKIRPDGKSDQFFMELFADGVTMRCIRADTRKRTTLRLKTRSIPDDSQFTSRFTFSSPRKRHKSRSGSHVKVEDPRIDKSEDSTSVEVKQERDDHTLTD